MRTYIRRIAVVAVAVIGIAAVTPRSVHAAADTAIATATIIAPITIGQTADLDFASIVPVASAQTVTVGTADNRTACTGGMVCTGTVTSGSFSIGGAASAGYTIAVTPATLTINRSGGGGSMTVTTWTTAPTSPATLSGTPPDTLTVGATLNVGASQAAGSYGLAADQFTVTVNYN